MTRRMADSVTPADLPAGFDLYGAYVDGKYANYAAVEAMYPGKVVGIAVFSTTNDGLVGDCESGDMTPQSAVTWVQLRRAAGSEPTIYCSEAIWSTVQAAFTAANEPEPQWWIAAYPGPGAVLYPGAVAHQWIDHGPYDESVVADYWPGVDPPPAPPDNLTEGENMTSEQTATQLHVWGIINNVNLHWWQDLATATTPPSAWKVEVLPMPPAAS
jgi:hypothetical protein